MTTESPPARLWLVRHGQTDWNLQGRIQGHQPTDLNAAGRAQAAELARCLADRRFAALWSSDLPRAYQTAEALAAVLGLPIATSAALRERSFGPHEGKTAAALHALRRVSEARAGDLADATGIPGVETDDALWNRVDGALRDIARGHPGGDVLVVTHGGPMTHLIYRVLGIPAGTPRGFSMANGIVAVIQRAGDGWELLSLADLPLVFSGRATLDTAHAPRE